MTKEIEIHKGSGLVPQSLPEAMELAKLLAQSTIVPKCYQGKPGDVLIAVQMGAELGLSPVQALQNISTINGRPCLWGDAFLAVVQGHPDCLDVIEHCDGNVATCTVKRRNRSPVTREFSLEDARAAGLLSKQGPWQQYRSRMLQMRARGFACRDAFPDALRGIHLAEEMRDTPPEPAEVSGGDASPARGVAALTSKIGDAADEVIARIGAAVTVEALEAEGLEVKRRVKSGEIDSRQRSRVEQAYRARLADLRAQDSEPPPPDGPPPWVDEDIERDSMEAPF